MAFVKKGIHSSERIARDYEWDEGTKVWSSMSVKWDLAGPEDSVGWLLTAIGTTAFVQKNLHSSERIARDYEWDEGSKIWSSMDVKWDLAGPEDGLGWAFSTKGTIGWTPETNNTSGWTQGTISD